MAELRVRTHNQLCILGRVNWVQANTRCSNSVCPMLRQRRRRWRNIGQTLFQRLVLLWKKAKPFEGGVTR